MPINKHSFARYQVIDACIRNRQRSYPDINYLIERCSKRLDQQISRSTIEKDLKAMKDEPEAGNPADPPRPKGGERDRR
ncbi:MAG: hypothetical protein NTW16_00390 [Bacteroidetes bacterium]|nr:hypothetical protein [Bacteroidota bacterium]